MQRNHRERTTPNTFVLKSLFFFWSCVKKLCFSFAVIHPSSFVRPCPLSFTSPPKKYSCTQNNVFATFFSDPFLYQLNHLSSSTFHNTFNINIYTYSCGKYTNLLFDRVSKQNGTTTQRNTFLYHYPPPLNLYSQVKVFYTLVLK